MVRMHIENWFAYIIFDLILGGDFLERKNFLFGESSLEKWKIERKRKKKTERGKYI